MINDRAIGNLFSRSHHPVSRGETIMNKTIITLVAAALLAGGVWAQQAFAQQVVAPSAVPVQSAPRVTTMQPTRQYRSYSVNSSRDEVRRNGPHSGDATWRHAGAKAHGHYATGK
jgi:hypothetical protein